MLLKEGKLIPKLKTTEENHAIFWFCAVIDERNTFELLIMMAKIYFWYANVKEKCSQCPLAQLSHSFSLVYFAREESALPHFPHFLQDR